MLGMSDDPAPQFHLHQIRFEPPRCTLTATGPVPVTLARLAGIKSGTGSLGLSGNQLNGGFPTWLLTNTSAGNGTLNLSLQARDLLRLWFPNIESTGDCNEKSTSFAFVCHDESRTRNLFPDAQSTFPGAPVRAVVASPLRDWP